MIKILRSNRSKVSVFYTVSENPTTGTWGSHQLLKAQYRAQDAPSWAVKDGIPNPRFEQLTFNTEWLEKMLAKYGELHCEYCGKPHLKIYHWSTQYHGPDLATTDHFFPSSKYPDGSKDEGNLIVACGKCNSNRKKSKIWDISKIRYPFPEERIFIKKHYQREIIA